MWQYVHVWNVWLYVISFFGSWKPKSGETRDEGCNVWFRGYWILKWRIGWVKEIVGILKIKDSTREMPNTGMKRKVSKSKRVRHWTHMPLLWKQFNPKRGIEMPWKPHSRMHWSQITTYFFTMERLPIGSKVYPFKNPHAWLEEGQDRMHLGKRVNIHKWNNTMS